MLFKVWVCNIVNKFKTDDCDKPSFCFCCGCLHLSLHDSSQVTCESVLRSFCGEKLLLFLAYEVAAASTTNTDNEDAPAGLAAGLTGLLVRRRRLSASAVADWEFRLRADKWATGCFATVLQNLFAVSEVPAFSSM